ncbi:MAG: peptide chain release factor N(5)-glutamine methyltransferase [Candidatus Latescibacteria bacterium]|nr:peptide chain release factor N(5)-glutamine methyltransferase [Candidatus Latescibacterota bacterium]
MSGAAPRTWQLLPLLEETSRFFAARNLENPRLQAELLLADVLALRRLDLYLRFDQLLSPAQVDAYREHVRQRLRGVPLQYITGKAGFRNLNLSVDPAVLIPRPETEILVEVALEYLQGVEAPQVLDVGCGSGAIALALAQECPAARVKATDLSSAALARARANARELELADRVGFCCGDLLDPFRPAGQFHLIASNPPYVRRGDLEGLEAQVRDHEPHLALDGGEDGLDFYRRLAGLAGPFLAPEGLLVLEVGAGQADEVAALLEQSGCFAPASIRPDLAGIPRVVSAARRAEA